jgi:hypothetical protein
MAGLRSSRARLSRPAADCVFKTRYQYGAAFASDVVGLETNNAHTHFERVSVSPWEPDDPATEAASFSRSEPSPDDWQGLAGGWWLENGLAGSAAHAPAVSVRTCSTLAVGAVTATVTITAGEAARLLFAVHDPDRYIYLELDTTGWRVGQVQDGAATTLCSRTDWHPHAGVATTLRLDLTRATDSTRAAGRRTPLPAFKMRWL